MFLLGVNMNTEMLNNDQLNLLDPKKIKFSQSLNPFQVNVTLPGQIEYLDIIAMPAFPLSANQELIHLYERSASVNIGKLIGIIENTKDLSEDNNKILQGLLKKTNHLPQIIKILTILDEFHYFHWYVETDRGQADFYIGSPRRHLTAINQSSLLIKDLKGDMYFIPDQNTLDKKSQDLISLTI